jgi:hypothetical protein
VFVYILSPSITTSEDDDTEDSNIPNATPIHVLLPECENVHKKELHSKGIKRSTIWEAITEKTHRLNVLITDSCTICLRMQPPDEILGLPYMSGMTCLAGLLLYGKGHINIHSVDPNGNNGIGELAWVPLIPDATERELTYCDDRSGTVFTNVFISTAMITLDDNETTYSPQQFISDLKSNFADEYKKIRNFLINQINNNKLISGIEILMTQNCRTFIQQFNDDGTPIKDQNENQSGAVAY